MAHFATFKKRGGFTEECEIVRMAAKLTRGIIFAMEGDEETPFSCALLIGCQREESLCDVIHVLDDNNLEIIILGTKEEISATEDLIATIIEKECFDKPVGLYRKATASEIIIPVSFTDASQKADLHALLGDERMRGNAIFVLTNSIEKSLHFCDLQGAEGDSFYPGLAY